MQVWARDSSDSGVLDDSHGAYILISTPFHVICPVPPCGQPQNLYDVTPVNADEPQPEAISSAHISAAQHCAARSTSRARDGFDGCQRRIEAEADRERQRCCRQHSQEAPAGVRSSHVRRDETSPSSFSALCG